MSMGLSFSFKSNRIFRMPKNDRYKIGDILTKNTTSKGIFSLLLYRNQIIQMARSKNVLIDTRDILLLINFVNSSTSMRQSETWTPICFPFLNSSGYLYSYIYFFEKSDISIIFICMSQDEFFECKKKKNLIEEKLKSTGLMTKIKNLTLELNNYTAKELEIPSLRHFVYCNSQLNQIITPIYTSPYNSRNEKRRIVELYKIIKDRLCLSSSQHKIYFHTSSKESILGWTSSSIELYAIFPLNISKNDVVNSFEDIKKWVKKEDDNLLINYNYTF
jgi:vacuolar fusion protein MON1